VLQCGEDSAEAFDCEELVIRFGWGAVSLYCCSQGTKAMDDAVLSCNSWQGQCVVSEDDGVRYHCCLGVVAEE